jgi:hypothetical protein
VILYKIRLRPFSRIPNRKTAERIISVVPEFDRCLHVPYDSREDQFQILTKDVLLPHVAFYVRI